MAHDDSVIVSLAHKRWSQGETGKVVVEDARSTAPFNPDATTAAEEAFLAGLALSTQPRRDLCALYQGWLDRLVALEAAQLAGRVSPPDSAPRGTALRDALDTHARLSRTVASLRRRAEEEKQLSRRVDLNLEIRRLEAAMAAISESLGRITS